MKLQGTVAIITGGAGEIAGAIAATLVREGADLAIADIKDIQEDVLRGLRKLGHRAIALHCDITDQKSVDSMVAQTIAEYGKVDLLVNSMGAGNKGPLEQLSVEDWDRVIAVNLKGVFLCSVAVAKEMMKRQKGNIVNIGSALSHNCFANRGAYGPSKAGLISLTRQMAIEWAKYNIRVNGVSPGPVMTAVTAEAMKTEAMKQRVAKIPLGRIATKEEVANTVLFLASQDCSYMTGQMLIVDGGGVLTSYEYP